MHSAGGATLEVTPLEPHIAAEVSGLTPGAIGLYERAMLRTAWQKHHVLVFRGMPLTEDEQLDLASSFGAVRKAVANVTYDAALGPGSVPAGEPDWQYDGLHQSKPYTGGILHAREVPTSGGEMRFANMCRVYAS